VPTLGFLASLLLLIGLLFGHRIAHSGPAAPLFMTGLITFLIVFGMGVAPLFDEPGATFAQRLFNIGIACVYAFAALALLDAGTRRASAIGPDAAPARNRFFRLGLWRLLLMPWRSRVSRPSWTRE
jgi:hypothetical protein